jgi:structural maintenance of chromosome 2
VQPYVMLEEAAGTRMYENKKESALKTLEKKQTKVDEIDKLLEVGGAVYKLGIQLRPIA